MAHILVPSGFSVKTTDLYSTNKYFQIIKFCLLSSVKISFAGKLLIGNVCEIKMPKTKKAEASSESDSGPEDVSCLNFRLHIEFY